MAKARARTKTDIRVLLTGFEPFDRFRTNPSEILVRSLDPERLGPFDGVNVCVSKLILPVTVDVFKALKKKTGHKRFDIVLHIGLSNKAMCTRLERRAKNCMNFKMPDNKGNVVSKRCIMPDAPMFLRSNIPIKAIVRRLQRREKAFEVSNFAGGYICNLLFYRSLHEASKRKNGPSIGFIHVPLFSRFSKKRALSALETIIRTCIEKRLKKA